LEEVRKSFPRLENWTGIYPTKNMRTLVAKAYEQVMEFSRTATEYFSSFLSKSPRFSCSKKVNGSAIGRLTMAIITPSSMGIDKAAAVIHKTLAEINSEAMYGLHGRSQNIETQVVSSGKNIDQLKAEAISSSEKLKRMEATNDLLRQYLQEQKEHFEAYKRSVERAHPSDLSTEAYYLTISTVRVQQEDQQRLKTLEEDLGVRFCITFISVAVLTL
jgi:regulator of replication initiation timing